LVDHFFSDSTNGGSVAHAIANETEELTASEMRDARLSAATEIIAEFSHPEKPGTPVVHANSRPTIDLKGGVTWSRLTAFAENGAEFLEINYDPGAMSGASMSHHEGREFGLILEGELVVELGFESYLLREGDSIIFESTTPHRLSNKGNGQTRAIWVVLSIS
jgi:uncharacterized cupin superfamily protein